MKTLSILGSTGSIGTQALEIAREHPNEFRIVGLSCHSNIELLKKQIVEFKPEAVAVFDEEKADHLTDELKADIPVYRGMDGLLKIAQLSDADTIVNALVGSIGVLPTVKAIEAGKNIALANKETLVAAGEIVMDKARKHSVKLMPIDSEHSAIFQCLNANAADGGNKMSYGKAVDDVESVTLTCSGGPFRNFKSIKDFESIKPADALKHPTWNMGAKITIDSATLMNKGFEVIEAHWLYGRDYEKIKVVVHPQSIIHSFVEFKDKSVLAQVGFPDMRIPIQYALSYPKRLANTASKPFNPVTAKELTFSEVNNELFPCLGFAYEAGKIGGTMPCAMNAANEVAVQLFLDGKIGFLGIAEKIKKTMDVLKVVKNPELDELLELDNDIKNDGFQVL
ncbi:1-deoxy-D-xylulose-5-phosphate reductoisomerase [Candidatus Woesearchaeota archaeon]|nr:1-deoxy-D-xylulose-5-phosphate reductoisomerase [Candidatus Woesearchaeota archaeon]